MTFLHSGLLLALALTAVPVVLHLLLKQKPKRVDFPALRLVQSRTKRSTRRLKLRHLLLLLLRILVIGGMVLAAARPLLPAADWSFRWWDAVIVLAVVAAAWLGLQWWYDRVAREPGQLVRDTLRRRGEATVFGAATIILILAILLPFGLRVSKSMQAAPSAEALDLPVAGVVVFDLSASMSYRQGGQTLLDVGREIVADHLGALPSGSKIAIADNATEQPVLFHVSRASIPTQLERLATSATAKRLNLSLRDALDAHTRDREQIREEGDSRDRYVRRIYVVTDLAKSAWQFPDGYDLERLLAGEDAPSLFVLDVGVESPMNRGFQNVSLSSEDLPRGGVLTLRSEYRTTTNEAVTADLFLRDGAAEARVGSKELSANGADITFQPTMSTERNLLNGSLKLATTDPLSIDDVRYFSVGVTPLPNVLLVADRPESTREIRFALGGDKGITVPSVYNLTSIRLDELSPQSLTGQDVVCLVNVPRLADSQWSELDNFVRDGGGLFTVLGSTDIESFTYNRAAAQEVLPARLDVWGSRPATVPASLIFPARNGPFIDRLRTYDANGLLELLSSARVLRYWRVQPQESTRVIARYTVDALPAVLSRQVGKGLSMMLTTALDLKEQKSRWNTIMFLDNQSYWVGIAFCDQVMRHLARVGSTQRNFVAGEIPTVPLTDEMRDQRLLLQTPDLRNLPVEISDDSYASFRDATVPGHYIVAAAGGEAMASFSVNYSAEESDLTRADEADLASVLGAEQFDVARNLDELNEDIDVARLGQEAFPVLVLLVIALFAGETLMSSRFYGDNPRPGGQTTVTNSGPKQETNPLTSQAP